MSVTTDDGRKPSFWRRRIVGPIVGQLQQGITPEKIALTLALGAVVSTFPILGSTSILCLLIAFVLKLNQAIMQLTSWLFYPLQFALLLPLYRAGEIFGTPHLALSIPQMMSRFRDAPLKFIGDFGLIALGGIGVWLIAAPLVTALLYFVLRPLLRGLAARLPRTPLADG
jgi:uncharacterized protein (DUF2062 family)